MSSLKVLDFSTPAAGAVRLAAAGRHGGGRAARGVARRMDLVRVLPPHVDGTSASHAYLNRNKRSIGLDLKRQGAREGGAGAGTRIRHRPRTVPSGG
ncbi:CoA transferase [Pseudomonas aeruginosa]